jgi:hypothetical protein
LIRVRLMKVWQSVGVVNVGTVGEDSQQRKLPP